MRDNTLKLWALAATAMLLLPASAYAAGLGRLTVLSTLGHTLEAEVELLSVQKNETITGRLASPEIYSQANAQYNNALVGTRVTLQRRPNGQAYLRVTTPRAVTEPFIELLIEINSENGRVMRQYTALLDPPGYGRAAAEIPPPAVTSAPQTRAAPAVEPIAAAPAAPAQEFAPPPAASAPAAAKPAAAPRSAPAPAASAGARQYGPIKSGETLGRIARSVKPEGVSLEQTLVGLYRQNPEAFIKKNMNLVRSGRILKVPEAEELASVSTRSAAQEVRLHVADFNAYRNRVADRAVGAPEVGSVASGRIGSRVAGPAAGDGPRDTVRLSRGEGKAGAKGGAADRVRALEEEAVARDKALAEANARIAKLETIIKDSQRAADLKSGTAAAPAQKGAEKAAPAAPPSTVAVAPPSTPAAKGPQAPAGGPPDSAKGASPDAAKGATTDPAAPAKGLDAPVEATPKAEPPPVAKAKPAPPPPPPPETGLVDSIMDEPMYLAVGGAVILLGGLGFMMARRRRSTDGKSDLNHGLVKIPPSLGGGPAVKGAPSGGASGRTAAPAMPAPAPSPAAAPAPAPAAAPAPARAPSPAAAAPSMSPGAAATPPATAPVPPPKRSADDNDLDFNVATGRSASAAGAARRPPPPELKPAPPAAEPARAPSPRAVEPPARAPEPPRAPPPRAAEPPPRTPQAAPPQPLMPDFALDTSALTPSSPKVEPKAPAADPHVVDFNLDPLPPVGSPLNLDKVSSEPPAPVDFKLDLKDLDINTPPQRTGGAAGRDDHWYDVQQKFDLAKAYEEMGDKDGARDILQEVVREGDTDQQAQAKKQLGSLG